MNAQRAIGAALLIGGLILLWLGMNESQSLASEMSEAFTGSPGDRVMWKIVVGAMGAIGGAVLMFLPGKSR